MEILILIGMVIVAGVLITISYFVKDKLVIRIISLMFILLGIYRLIPAWNYWKFLSAIGKTGEFQGHGLFDFKNIGSFLWKSHALNGAGILPEFQGHGGGANLFMGLFCIIPGSITLLFPKYERRLYFYLGIGLITLAVALLIFSSGHPSG